MRIGCATIRAMVKLYINLYAWYGGIASIPVMGILTSRGCFLNLLDMDWWPIAPFFGSIQFKPIAAAFLFSDTRKLMMHMQFVANIPIFVQWWWLSVAQPLVWHTIHRRKRSNASRQRDFTGYRCPICPMVKMWYMDVYGLWSSHHHEGFL